MLRVIAPLPRDCHVHKLGGILGQVRQNMPPIPDDFDKFPKDSKFQFQLDGIDDAFEALLVDDEVEVFDHQEADVKGNDEDVDGEELGNGATRIVLFHDAKQFCCFVEVNARDDKFLQHESSHLELFDHVPGGAKLRLRVAVVCGEADYGG